MLNWNTTCAGKTCLTQSTTYSASGSESAMERDERDERGQRVVALAHGAPERDVAEREQPAQRHPPP